LVFPIKNSFPLFAVDITLIRLPVVENNFSYLKPLNAPFYYISGIIENIRILKREGVSPEEFKKTLTGKLTNTPTKDLEKNLDLLKIYSLYQQQLLKHGKFDFEDMINWVVDKLEKDPDLLLSHQERLSYFLVDEYQDTNSAQNQLVFKLASYWGEKANLFVVGDVNQSIFRFQGASLENTKEFVARFPKTTLINLNQNYRSTQTILNSAHAVIKNNSPKSIKLKSNLTAPGKPVNTAHFSHSIFEDYYLAKDIKNL